MGVDWLNRDLLWLFLVRVLRSFAQGYLGVITPLYVAVLGYNAFHLGILFAVGGLVNALLAAVTGVLADRFGRKTFLILISLMMAAGAAGFALTHEFAWLVAAGAIGSIGRGGALAGGTWGPFYPAAQALVAEQTADLRRTTVFGALSFAGVMAAAAGSLLAALPNALTRATGLPVLEGYRILFIVAAGLSVAIALAVLPVHERHRNAGRGDPAPRGAPAPRAPGRPLVLGLSSGSWRLVCRFMVTNATNGLAIGMLGPFVVYWFYRRFGASAGELARLFFVLNLVSAIPYLMAGRIALAYGSVRSIVATRAVSAALLLGVVIMPSFLSAAALYTVRVFFNVFSIPVRQSYLMGLIEPAERAGAAGFANLPSQIASAVSPYLAGYFMQSFELALPLELAAALQGLNTFLYWLFFRNIYPPEESS